MTATTSRRTRPAGAAAPALAPDGRGRKAAARPRLRVVKADERTPAARARRQRRRVALAGCIAIMSLFALVGFHAVLTQNQFRLEDLRVRSNAEQARFDRLRLQVAELESPDRVVASAGELGMVQPPEVRYLAPIRPLTGPEVAAESAGGGADDWSAVKPLLAAQP